jgi:LysM repeat protein
MMENNLSKNKYRGFKHIVLIFLVVAAIGFAWFFNGGRQSADQQANLNGTYSSLAADAKAQGKGMLDRAGFVKEGVHYSLANVSDKIWTPTQSQDLLDKAENIKEGVYYSLANVSEKISSITQSKGLLDKAGLIKEGIHYTLDNVNEKIATMASNSGDDALKNMSGYVATNTRMEPEQSPMAEDVKEASSMFNSKMEHESSAIQLSGTSQAALDKNIESAMVQMTNNTPNEVPVHSERAMANKNDSSGSTIRCIGTPPRGKDLGDHYVVASCETMSIISKRTGVKLKDLKNHNPQVENPNLIYPNQRLLLPPHS